MVAWLQAGWSQVWLAVSWRNQGGRATCPSVSPHPADQVGDWAEFWGTRSSQALLRPPHGTGRPSLPLLCYAKQVTRPAQIRGGEHAAQIRGGEHTAQIRGGRSCKVTIKGHGYRWDRVGGHFAINVPHQVSWIFHPFLPFITHINICENIFDWELENQLCVCVC